MGAHQIQTRNQLRKQRELFAKSYQRYHGKLDLAKTYEENGLPVPFELRESIRKAEQLLENKGAL